MNKQFFTIAVIVLAVQVGFSQIKIWKAPKNNKSIEIVQWEVNDIVYTTKQKVENPFNITSFAHVKSSKGVQKVPLFFNGNNEWVFRYSSSTIGNESFEIVSSLKELNGKKGKFVISKNKKTDRHGGIVLQKENPKHFFYEDGKHYFNLAFECDWLFALDYGKEEIVKTKQLVNSVKENGFNQIVMNVYAYGLDLDWVKDPKLDNHPEHNYGEREDIFPFLGSNSNPDYSALNVDFFKHFDKVISELHSNEIISHLMIYVWNKRVAWPEPGSEADNMYYDYVINRYQAFPNVIWDVSKEATSKIVREKYPTIEEHIRERAIRTRKMDGFNRLLSVHEYGFCKKNPDVVDFISTQDWKLSIFDQMIRVYNEFPSKPVFNIEHGGYEESPYNVFPGGYANAEACLRRNYLCLFAGVYNTYYWQGAAWTAVIHNPFDQPKSFKKPRFEYFKYMRNLFDTVNYENFQPVTKYNSRSYNLTNYKDGIILLYVPEDVYNDDVKNQIENEFDFSKATKQWFNTLTGEFSEIEKFEYVNKYPFWDPRPWRDEADAILIVKGLQPKTN